MRRIAELRKKHNFSQSELAEKLGLSQQTISKYERGHLEPDINTLIILANLFDVSIDYLLGITNLPNNSAAKNIPEPIYMKLANEAQNMHLAEDDVDYIINMYRRFTRMDQK